ncbi:hypothetical protein [Polluticoccus soli]|uniref:hypothetical protein n=1 Tax=Polluticoccus soli TaxID=3034150 RepID=UPI0023E27831|nr:hypothetical protein [Flavipsychrobacter sp. JY13-12]
MHTYTSEYNKQINKFREGIKLVRKRHGNFFDNMINGRSIYDLKDINSYFEVRVAMGQTVLEFRPNSGLPDKIRDEISTHFYSVWPNTVEANN